MNPDARGRWGVGQPRRQEASVWPDARQELLLRAAVGAGEPALAAWTEWRRQVDPGAADPSSQRVLPLLYRNLSRQGLADPRLAQLRPVYQRSWIRNQQLLHALRAALLTLHAVGIPTLVLKGAALGPLYYEDEGARPMGDLDLLVPETAFEPATRTLAEAGWTTLHPRPRFFDTRFDHAIDLVASSGEYLDLHCHVLASSCERGADRAFWEAARPATIRGVPTRTLCPADLLVHICVHGVQWIHPPPINWVADALTVLARARAEIDWARIAEVARARRAVPAVTAALEHLADRFGAGIPSELLEQLRQVPISRTERWQSMRAQRDWRGHPGWALAHHWTRFRRGIGAVGGLRTLREVPGYIRSILQTDLRRAPLVLAARGLRLLGYRLGLYRY